MALRYGGVLVTGGTGTFGRAFIRKALADGLHRRVIAYSRDEVKQAAMQLEFGEHERFRAFLGDVRDYDRLYQACQGVEIVIAAAALKRVDSTAYNPMELVRTNVLGVENTIRAATAARVSKVVVISSDKAVAPANPYGVSKAMAETLAVTSNAWTFPQGTSVLAVRYGNVLGSRGSVVEIWRAALAASKPLTLTDKRMTRFAVTIEQAVALVSGLTDHGIAGTIAIPKLPCFYVADLARAIAGPTREWVETGVRPGGEKLAEALLSDEEIPRTREYNGYFAVMPAQHDWSDLPGRIGTPIPAGIVYRSDIGPFLTPQELRRLLDTTEAGR